MILLRAFRIFLSVTPIITLNTIYVTAVSPEIKLVNLVFRHGDRTPDNNGYEMFPNDPYQNYSFYPTGLGQLTINGKKREYEFGKILRSRYNNLLGKVYTPKHAVAHSSDYDRTKMSLQLVLAALFPPANIQRWHSDLNWQPIPISYLPRVDDNLFLGDECPQYLNEYDRVLKLPETEKRMYPLKDMMRDLTNLTGKNIEKPIDIFYLYHTFVAESSMGLPLPKWAHNYFPYGELFHGIVTSYNISNSNILLKRLFAGRLIRSMKDSMIAAQGLQQDAPVTKIYLYSGHETNIASLLHAFGVYKPHVPEYSSAIILELLELDKEYYVKLLYYLGVPPTINELQILGCDMLCPFDKFIDLIADLIPSDEELICDKRLTPDYTNTKYPVESQEITYNLIKSSRTDKRRLR